MFHKPFISLVLITSACYCPAEAASGGGINLRFSQDRPVTVTVSGTVRDQRTAVPIPNALIRAHLVVGKYAGPELFDQSPSQQVIANGKGEYQITFVTPLTLTGFQAGHDTLCVYASAPGYECQPQYGRPNVTLKNTNFTNFNFSLKPGKRVHGVVVDTDSNPVKGGDVRVQNSMNGDWNHFGAMGRTVTGDDGSFELWIGDGSDYLGNNPWLCIQKQGAGTMFAWNILAREELGTLVMNPGEELAGKVVARAGVPVPNCEVSVRWSMCGLMDKTRTDAEGKYHLRGVLGEDAIREFMTKKNGRWDPAWGGVEVHAVVKPGLGLKNSPHFKVNAHAGSTTQCPDVIADANTSVSGRLLPSKTSLSLGSLLVRLDGSWENMVEADMNGHFTFPYVPPGKHTLTVYLPHNLRYDRGIGRTQFTAAPGKPLNGLEIQLEDLAEVRVQYLDGKGNPLSGISASATRSRTGQGFWTEGTVSDEEGWAMLYLYPQSTQYVRGLDRMARLTAESSREVNPKPGEVLEALQVVMVPVATLFGRLLNAEGQPFAGKAGLCKLQLADGTLTQEGFRTDDGGNFRMERITPGILSLSFEIDGVEFSDPLGKPLEGPPGQSVALGDIVLKNGSDRKKVIQEKHALALQNPEEITKAAQELFQKIQTADYARFVQPGADWRRFPIVGSYQTRQWYDELVKWICTTFKANPIVRVELGQVFANPATVIGLKGLPTVPYKLTLTDGTVLQGTLPFEYNFDGGKGHWQGVEGIDWHLQKQR